MASSNCFGNEGTMLGLGWDMVASAKGRTRSNSEAIVRAVMLPAGAVVGLAFAALAVIALKRLPAAAE